MATTNSNQSATPEELQYWATLDELDASAFAASFGVQLNTQYY